MKKWTVIIILAIAQFVMILDSTVMNVSISTVAEDLGTSISGMQAAITLYALTMAALMLTGGKLGDRWGRLTAFRIGSVVYGIGSLITALAPSLTVLLIGWSLIEGLGAILVIPAIASLAAVNYTGKSRIIAFSILGAITGLAAAVGPIIGGYVTTYLSWRYVFAAETLVMIGVLLVANKIYDQKVSKAKPINIQSSFLVAVGMSMLVFGVLQSKTWGWVAPTNAPTINGEVFAPFGISIVSYLIIGGLLTLGAFLRHQRKLENEMKNPLLKASLLTLPALRSGLSTLLSQYFAIAALFFVIPVYLQTILGYDALETGLKLVPLSIGLVAFSAIGSKLSISKSAKYLSRIGQLAMAFGVLIVLGSLKPELGGTLFWIGMFVVGAGFGLLASQLGNVNMSAVSKADSAEVGGLQGTFQNLGSSFGTAVVGSVFMILLASGFTSAINSSSNLSQQAKDAITIQSEDGVDVVSQEQAESYIIDQGASKETAETAARIYEDAQLDALREALFVVFAALLLSLLFSANLPNKVAVHKA